MSDSKTILSVENDAAIREMIVTIVESLGHKCIEAKDAREALKIQDKEFIDLTLGDVGRPDQRDRRLGSEEHPWREGVRDREVLHRGGPAIRRLIC